ncbi:phospholipase A1-II 7-like [Setaria italica]|uniref:phospholipase A1-II 7-like n=1 Tax=Setaria italica TaxID=4555 RepID=UPI000BE5C4E9|nr:phospholipase A1-II 7-like [Setaria italica]
MALDLQGHANRWRELHGKDLWKGLLDPLDIDLRKSIISYGELAQATYDGFYRERRSPHAGACLHDRFDLLCSSGASAAADYAVTKFVGAARAQRVPPPASTGAQPGRVVQGVQLDRVRRRGHRRGRGQAGRRDVVVAWRGTLRNLEWVNDFDFTPVPAAPVVGAAAAAHPLAMAHRGFLSAYRSSNASSTFNSPAPETRQVDTLLVLIVLTRRIFMSTVPCEIVHASLI